ncbi:MAG: glycosyltransferase, partial [Alphaproteobacteria bacterium]|nr:glycosyltransferase [Alphaproteobacteria bacterium]
IGSVPFLARRYGLRVTAGAWIDGRMERNEREIAAVIAQAREFRNVSRILIGNEAVLRADVTVEELVTYIRRVRTQVRVPVSTAEPWHVWLAHPELGREVDFIAIHVLPYWEGIPADKAVEYAFQRYQQVKDAFPTKPVVITEFGWPSEGRMRRDAAPSTANQGVVLRGFLNEANRRGLDYYVMEAFDQPWKRNIEGSVGGYWGIWDAARNPKFPLEGPVMSVPHWHLLALIASAVAFLPMVWFLYRWSDLKPTGRIFFAGLIQICASVLVWTGYVGASQYFSFGTGLMWAVLVPLLVMLLVMLLAEGLEVAEVIWSRRFRRRFLPFVGAPEGRLPKVSLHLPICNEPPQMVMQTLDSLAALDYPDFEVIVIDNNTKDPNVWRPVEAYCEQLGPRFRFFHEDVMKGFKAGALNFALARTAPDAEVIGVIDSDYVVSPDWLRSLVPYFDNPSVGFVQAPQDHRDWHGNAFKEMINWEYAGFFNIGMVQRNERDAIIQHGTMTLIRRAALAQVDGWAEWCICEDAELGLRLLVEGYQSVYVNKRFGHGLTPDSFLGYKKQRFRWAYGAVQILKRHWREMLPGPGRRLNWAQRYHFVAGWMPWFADAIGVAFSVAAVFWTIGVLALPQYFEFPLTLFLVPTIGVFAIKVLQFLWLYKARVDCTFRQRLGAGIAGLSLTYTVGKAMIYGIFTSKLPFMRTPKCEDQPAAVQAILMAWEEILLGILLWLSAFSVWRVYSYDDPEAKLWVVVLLAQSLPYLAAIFTASVNAIGDFKVYRRRQQALAPAAGE